MQSEANKIALAQARQRVRERCAADPVYRQQFLDASRKGHLVQSEMRARGELPPLTEKQRLALAVGRALPWIGAAGAKNRKFFSAKMRETNLRKAAGEFPDWEQNRKRSVALAMKKRWSDSSSREKQGPVMSAAIKAAWSDPEYKARQAQRISRLHKELWATPEYRKKMESRPLPPGRMFQRIAFTDRKSRHFVLKSEWEKTFAEWLDKHLLDWMYEPVAIDLKNGSRYFPDFWIEQWQSFVEIKGRAWGLEKVRKAIALGYKIEVLRSVSLMAMDNLLASFSS